jgi:hypothetical protein
LAKSGYSVEAISAVWLPPGLLRALEATTERGGYEGKLARQALSADDRMKLNVRPLAPAIAELARLEEEQFFGRLAEEKRLDDIKRSQPPEDPPRIWEAYPELPKLGPYARSAYDRAVGSGQFRRWHERERVHVSPFRFSFSAPSSALVVRVA